MGTGWDGLIVVSPSSSVRIDTISPTKVEKLIACPQRVAFEQQAEGSKRPKSSTTGAARLGVAVHRAIEICLGTPPVDAVTGWNQACDELSTDGDDPRAAPDARRMALRLERHLPRLVDFIARRNPSLLLREESLTSPDGRVSGQLDLLVCGDAPCVIDHKTGVVIAEGEPLDRYRRQLVLYAWLADVTLQLDVAESLLFSLRDGLVAVDTCRSVREGVISDVLHAQDQFNARVPGSQPANPSEETCMFCPFLGECDEAWATLRSGSVSRLGRGEAAIVEVVGDCIVATNGLAAIPIHVLAGSVAGDGVLVDVPSQSTKNLARGSTLRCWGLGLRSADPLSLSWRSGVSGFASGSGPAK